MTTENTEPGTVNAEPTVNTESPEAAPEANAAETNAPEKSADPVSDESASEAAKLLAQRKQTAKERVQQAVARQREAERQSAAKDKYIADLENRLAKAPDPAKYEDNAEYTADVMEHRMDRRELERAKTEKQNAETSKHEAVAEAWSSRVADFKTVKDDFEQVAFSAPISEPTALLIAEMDDGPAIAYELGNNHAEARLIDRLPALLKAVELGRIAERMSAPPPPKKITQAPAPIDPVKGRGAAGSKSIDDLSMSEYAALVAKEMKQ